MMKLRLNGGEIAENVSVVELEIVEDGRTGGVVNELRALVKKGRVVLIRFDNEKSSLPPFVKGGMGGIAPSFDKGELRFLEI